MTSSPEDDHQPAFRACNPRTDRRKALSLRIRYLSAGLPIIYERGDAHVHHAHGYDCGHDRARGYVAVQHMARERR